MSPFQVLYGIDAQILVTLELPALKLAQAVDDECFTNALDKIIMFLSKLEEQTSQVAIRIEELQSKVKRLFDKKTKERKFQINNLVLLWDKRREPKGKHGKFDSLWLGPFKIRHFCGDNTYYLSYPDGTHLDFPYNGKYLKHYQN